MMSKNESEHIPDELLQMFLDGELDTRRRSTMEGHLVSCETCSRRLESWQDLFQQLEELPDEELQRDLASALEDGHALTRRPRAHRLVWLAEGAALLLLVIFAGTWIWSGWQQVFQALPLDSAIQWAGSMLSIMTAVFQTIEAALVSVGPALLPTLPDWAVLPTQNAWIWVVLVASGLLWLFGNRLFLPRAARSNGRGR